MIAVSGDHAKSRSEFLGWLGPMVPMFTCRTRQPCSLSALHPDRPSGPTQPQYTDNPDGGRPGWPPFFGP